LRHQRRAEAARESEEAKILGEFLKEDEDEMKKP
jgi:hypothetical protein